MKKKLLAFIASLLVLMPAVAHEFTYGGINYIVLNEDGKTCSTKPGTWNASNGSTWGKQPGTIIDFNDNPKLVIPSVVNDGTNDYTVIALGECSFGPADHYVSEGCTVTLPETIETIGKYAFGEFVFTKINIPSKVTEIPDYLFCGNTKIKTISLPENITTIGEYAFRDTKALTSMTLPEGLVEIKSHAFDSCSLNTVVLPNSVTTLGDQVFRGSSSLKQVTLSESIEEIPTGTFFTCKALKSITLPKSLKNIGVGALRYCDALTEVYYPTSHPAEFGMDDIDIQYISNATLYVYADGVEAAKQTEPWKYFAKIEGMEGSGVNEAEAELAGDVEVFNLSGAYVGGSIAGLQPGIYVVRQDGVSKKLVIK